MNKLINDDCFNVMASMPADSVDFVLTDIPYGECSGFTEGGLRKINRDAADKDADGSEFDYIKYTAECMRICKGNVIIFCGRKQISGIITEMEKHNAQMIRLIFWDKPNVSPMNGQFFFLNSSEQAVACRQKNAYFSGHCEHPLFVTPTRPIDIHDTPKPIDLFKRLIELCCPPDGVVFDGCAGSFTTAVAATQCHRQYICVEKSKEFYDKAMKYYDADLRQQVMF